MDPFVKKLIDHKKKENKSGVFLKNGLIEILLVKVGILLALAIYGAYIEYKEHKQIQAYFLEIHHEISPAIQSGKNKIKQTVSLVNQLDNCARILSTGNKDSIFYLKENLGVLLRVRNQNFSFPILKEFLTKGNLNKVRTKEIIKLFRAMQQELDKINEMHDSNILQNQIVTQPYANKYLNYVALATLEQQNLMVQGGPNSNIGSLFDNLEFWNLLAQKIEGLRKQQFQLQKFTDLLTQTEQTLRKELKIIDENSADVK